MTSNEFNKKYEKYIKPGFEDQGLEFGGEAVIDFLDDIFKDLTKISGFQYSQIKVKFNSVRFYSNLDSRILSSFIEQELKVRLNLR